ncbi:propionyl-CoA synthetase [Breoghania sp.]|uniref:propionyl-CoA synthetase n=1 Tax=Breoghania sp. TaxID=2065378 RepID=UPI0029CA04E1|nr:propionyl-CoA synthetase [Breoghania sp.]
MASRYHEVYQAWRDDPEGFWSEAAAGIDWSKPWDKVFDPDRGVFGQWFAGAETNTCYNCLDRHVERGRPGQAAVIYDSPITGKCESYTYAEMLERVNALAGVLVDRGVAKGDRVIIYMPMVPQALMAMLACARIGAVHSVVFGGFAAHELATRIDDCLPKAIIAASCGIEPNRTIAYMPLISTAIEQAAHKPDFCLVFQREELTADLVDGRDIDAGAAVQAEMSKGRKVPCVPVAATDPLYILYTSGTTGRPKGVVRDNGGHMVALKWSMSNLYGIEPGEVFWTASDVGWVVGHSYIVYAPLLHGCTTVVFEGKPVGTPDAGTFWRVIADHGVSALFTAPTAFRAIRKEDPDAKLLGQYDLASLRTLFLAGERADPETIKWAEEHLKVPVVDHWWQTETGWCIAGNPVGLGLLPIKHGSPTVAMPGYDIQVLDDAGHPVPAGTLGNIVVKLPLPPACLPTLWENDQRFREAYLLEFPGYYKTADAGFCDEDGYLFIMARTDDIINVAGHRLSTGAMEEVLAQHPDVAECAVVGIADQLKGQLPCGFVVLKSGVDRDPQEVERELVSLVRQEIGPVAAFKVAVSVDRLPKTRSGKILRATMRQIADGEEYRMPATIDDPGVLDEIADAIRARGISRSS